MMSRDVGSINVRDEHGLRGTYGRVSGSEIEHIVCGGGEHLLKDKAFCMA